MRRNISYDLESRYDEINTNGTKNYLASHSQWGRVAHDVLTALTEPGSVDLLVSTVNHVMALSLEAKHAAAPAPGTMAYTMRMYDPNRVTLHMRAEEINLNKIKSYKMYDFLLPLQMKFIADGYYKPCDEYRTNGPVSLFTVVPGLAHQTRRRTALRQGSCAHI